MGCTGCELWPTIQMLIAALVALILSRTNSERKIVRQVVKEQLKGIPHATAAWHARYTIIEVLEQKFPSISREDWVEEFEKSFRCYAGILHLYRGAKPEDWNKSSVKGYARIFDQPEKFPGRMVKAAKWGPPTESEYKNAPWLKGLPRLIFISDMGDSLCEDIDFDYLKEEIIDKVTSPNGQRHIWLWLTKRPKRMADFASWLNDVHGLPWPPNLVAMTSVTNRATRSRIDALRKVPAKFRGLSVEPLTEDVSLDLTDIHWVITGGESGKYAREFDLEWARSIQEQCHEADIAFFMKQLGANIVDDEFPVSMVDGHGGDWSAWPADLRVREFPEAFYDLHADETKML